MRQENLDLLNKRRMMRQQETLESEDERQKSTSRLSTRSARLTAICRQKVTENLTFARSMPRFIRLITIHTTITTNIQPPLKPTAAKRISVTSTNPAEHASSASAPPGPKRWYICLERSSLWIWNARCASRKGAAVPVLSGWRWRLSFRNARRRCGELDS